MFRTFLWSSLTVILIILFQSVILSNIVILPAMPDLILLFVLYISFNNGSSFGSTVGFFSGLLLDFLSASPIGINALTKTITGYFSGKLTGKFNLNFIIIPCSMAFVGTILKFFIVYLTSFFIKNIVFVYSITSKIFYYEIFFNVIFAPIVFMILNIFSSIYKTDG